MKSLVMLALLLWIGAPLAAAEPPRYDPPKTTVAVLPTGNDTGEKDPTRNREQREAAEKEMADGFLRRGFRLAPRAAVSVVLGELKIDLADAEQRTPANFSAIGKKLGAKLVAFVVVTDSRAEERGAAGGWERPGARARTMTWLVDVDREEPILRAKEQEARWAGVLGLGNSRPERRFARAIEKAVSDTVAPFLQQFRQVKLDGIKRGTLSLSDRAREREAAKE